MQEKKISTGQVARIWNERAKAMGFHAHYSRFSVHARRVRGHIREAEVTAHGYLFFEQDAWSIELFPGKGRKSSEEESDRAIE